MTLNEKTTLDLLDMISEEFDEGGYHDEINEAIATLIEREETRILESLPVDEETERKNFDKWMQDSGWEEHTKGSAPNVRLMAWQAWRDSKLLKLAMKTRNKGMKKCE